MTALYVPPTEESDHKKQNQSLQLIGGATASNTTSIATNTTNITALQAQTAGYESAWTSYTPTITSGGGTPTTTPATGYYKLIGKIVHWQASVLVTNLGTATGALLITLPASALHNTVLDGMNVTATIKLNGFCVATNNNASYTKYDGTSPWANNAFYMAGVYEST